LLSFYHRKKQVISFTDDDAGIGKWALRHSVIHRKVTNGLRSYWDINTYAALVSIIDTAELAGVRAFGAILSLFGSPSFPIPIGGEST
jgi:hypothetical protein